MSISRARIDESAIIKYYRERERRQTFPIPFPLCNLTLTTTPLGLGDSVVLTDLPRAAAAHGRTVSVHLPSWSFRTLMRFNPYYQEYLTPFWVAADVLREEYDLGNGHFIQRIRRAYGFTPELTPHGCLEVHGADRKKGHVVLHFEAGAHSGWQRQHIHPRAREVYPVNLAILQQFINDHPEMHFLEVGKRFSGLENVVDFTGQPLDQTITRMAACEYFVGIMSGPLHIAAALHLRVVNIVNFPDASEIYLPTLKDIDLVESEWYYPQSVLLHQDGEGEIVPRFTRENLERAFDGDIYPYWSDRYLPLIHEKLQ